MSKHKQTKATAITVNGRFGVVECGVLSQQQFVGGFRTKTFQSGITATVDVGAHSCKLLWTVRQLLNFWRDKKRVLNCNVLWNRLTFIFRELAIWNCLAFGQRIWHANRDCFSGWYLKVTEIVLGPYLSSGSDGRKHGCFDAGQFQDEAWTFV